MTSRLRHRAGPGFAAAVAWPAAAPLPLILLSGLMPPDHFWFPGCGFGVIVTLRQAYELENSYHHHCAGAGLPHSRLCHLHHARQTLDPGKHRTRSRSSFFIRSRFSGAGCVLNASPLLFLSQVDQYSSRLPVSPQSQCYLHSLPISNGARAIWAGPRAVSPSGSQHRKPQHTSPHLDHPPAASGSSYL